MMEDLSESAIEEQCVRVAHYHHGELLKVRIVGQRGANDRLLVLPYVPTVYVELKDDAGEQSALQKRFERRIVSLGHSYWVIRSAEAFDVRIRAYLNHWKGLTSVADWSTYEDEIRPKGRRSLARGKD